MADGATDADVQQHDPTQAPAPESEPGVLGADAPAEPDAADAPEHDTLTDERASEAHEPSALEPGGKRFKQVYARAKDAETKLQQLREEKARLEGQLEATRTAPPVPEPKVEPRLTWTQLEAGIAEGKITQAQALDYRDETLRQDLKRDFDQQLREERTTRERSTTVSGELAQYKQAIPAILSVGTPERQKVEREFAYLVSIGYDAKDLRTELIACRTALGDVRTIKEKQLASTIPTDRGTMQDISANGKPKTDAKDPLKAITAEQRKYYQHMIDRGQYKGWKEVREELEFVPKR